MSSGVLDVSRESQGKHAVRKEELMHSISEISLVSSSGDSADIIEDSPLKVAQLLEDSNQGQTASSPVVIKRIFAIFTKERADKENETNHEADLIDQIVKMTHQQDGLRLDKVQTNCLSLYNPIERHRIRCINLRSSSMLKKFTHEGKVMLDFVLLLLQRKSSSVEQQHGQLVYLNSALKLFLTLLEYGLIPVDSVRKLIFELFLKTEQLFKIELFMTQDQTSFKDETFDVAMDCKSYSSRILLQLVVLVNDSWFFESFLEATKPVNTTEVKNKRKFKLCHKKTADQQAKKCTQIFFQDSQFYSLFSFMMFNYLLHELQRGPSVLECPLHREAMHQLVLFVSDHRQDPFIASFQLLKAGYLKYYQGKGIELEFVRKAESLLGKTDEIVEAFRVLELVPEADQRAQGLERLETQIGLLFSELEMLMGLQDDKFSIRLMLAEKKMPSQLVDIFLQVQTHYTVDGSEELFVQGIKVLNQMCKQSYPGICQILRGEGWHKFKELIEGRFCVFALLFLKQLLDQEEDRRFLYLNRQLSRDLIAIFRSALYKLVADFHIDAVGHCAKDLVSIYVFEQLMTLMVKNPKCDEYLHQNFGLQIAVSTHRAVFELVLPLLRDNSLQVDSACNFNLIKKTWVLEDCSFLISLTMLAGGHLKGLVLDFCYSTLRLYNRACRKGFLSSFQNDILGCLPTTLHKFDYLSRISDSEGIKIRTELLVTYCTFRVFPSSTRINQTYTTSELSLQSTDTSSDLMPKNDLVEIPSLILQEIATFERSRTSEHISELELDYILRGVCQATIKFVNGVIWNFNSIDSEENVRTISKFVHELNQKLHSLKRLVSRFKKTGKTMQYRISNPLSKMDYPLGDSEQLTLLNNSITSLMYNLNEMIADTRYEWILKEYEQNKKEVPLTELFLSQELLQPLASFKYFGQESLKTLTLPLGMQVDRDLDPLLLTYYRLKVEFLVMPQENLFYKVLQSKMGNLNQRNLVTYVVNWLDVLDLDAASSDSLWVNRQALDMVIFLDNTMYWCPQSRIKLFECLEKDPEKREKLLSIIYKGQRDSFCLLSYSPFFNSKWQELFAHFYVCSSFIMQLCKQNCQEFKTFLGEFVPDLGCGNHRKLKLSLLLDSSAVLIKYMYFSGISSNKSPLERQSDRLSTVYVSETMMRGIIDMLTGPCVSNQMKAHTQGCLIWIHMFNRLITDLRSKYYEIVDSVLDFLLSLLEGNNHDIMNSLASNFDIPVLYNFMSNIVLLLNKRIMAEKALKQQRQHRNKDDIVPLKRAPGLRKYTENPRFTSVTKSKQSMIKRAINEVKPQPPTNLEQIQDQFKLTDWQQLTEMYKNGEFDQDISLNCCIKIFIFLSRVAYTSKKYQIFFDKKDKDLQEQYFRAGFKEEDVKANKAVLRGSANAPEDLLVYYFMKSITARVEIKDNHSNSEIFIFPKPPCCFFLKETTMKNFINTCQIENTEAKLIDMFQNFDQFEVEMKNYQWFKSRYSGIGHLISDKSFTYFRVGCYLISALINLFLLFEVEMEDKVIYPGRAEVPTFILSCLLILVCFVILILWIIGNFYVAWSSSLKKFNLKHPYKNPLWPTNLIFIIGEIFMRREVINFILHILFALLGITGSPIAQTLHLILIINISDTTKYVLKAVTQHSDQLLATVSLVTIIIYIFSIVIGKYYADEFRQDEANNVRLCSSLKSCYLSILNLGLTRGGGISESLMLTDINSERTNFYYKLIVTLGFYIFVNIICLNVIFGIIIDTFSELRDKQRMREWDQYNVCDICGIERKIFEKKGMNFDIHKGVQHNLWDYVFYLEYLQNLDLQSLTGFEYFVFTQFKNKSTAWLPINSTIFLRDSRDDEQLKINQLEKKLTDFRNEVTALVDNRFNTLVQLIHGVGQRVDRALMSLKETKDILEGEEKEMKNSIDIDNEDEHNGAIKIINLED